MAEDDRSRELREEVLRSLSQCMTLVLLNKGTEEDLAGFLRVLKAFMVNGFNQEEQRKHRHVSHLEEYYQKNGGREAVWQKFLDDLRAPTRRVLANTQIDSFDSLLNCTEIDLISLPRCGKVAMRDVQMRVEERGFRLKPY